MSFDPRTFRNALGQFTTGVCVITASPKGYEPFGMTVNSFASVSLDPALVLWSLRNDSECYAAFEAADGFAVNVLTQEQAALSNQYSKKDAHQLSKDHYRIGKSGLPVLRGALTSFECDIWQRYDGGDHLILVGKVTEMDLSPTGKPLVFQGGAYRELR
ncbi:flavin reductase family protein [Spongiibacter tropicus]|uniref:flavin reductase family protein n=1 Tax=Spongiibacter tropicus TaxID=454602 RepID=UPI002354D858|nr:flavin reductase family protein [Spongiibacter tropicus]|tara:strand:- start:26461 stop:26937 length:477 start_codon:yes stop_codon:yes gene_type:complete